MASVTVASSLTASLSYRVPTARHSFSHPTPCSTTARRRYASRSNRTRPSPGRWSDRSPRDDRLDAVAGQPSPDVRVAVSLVPGQLHRPAPRAAPAAAAEADAIHQRLELRAFLPLPSGDDHRQRHPAAVADQVHLRAEATARAAQGVVGRLAGYRLFFEAPAAERLARTLVPSTQKSSGSIRPSALSRACRCSRMRSSVPVRRRAL